MGVVETRGVKGPAQVLTRPSKNILIIEDDEDSAATMGLELMRAGYGVHKAGSREEALAILDYYIYDFILLDYCMPGMSAGEFVDKVRARRPNSKIVLMTAKTDVARHAAEMGIEFCLAKPFDPVVLIQRLEQFEAPPSQG